MSIEDKVKKIIAEKLSVDLEEVVPEASFVDDLGCRFTRSCRVDYVHGRGVRY